MIRCFGLTDVGSSRTSNEDAFALEPDLGLFIVADGMGGAQAGERAAAIAIETIVDGVRCSAPARSAEVLSEAIRQANHNILNEAAENPDYQGMGTTVVAVLVEPPAAHIASVGDSRLYLWRSGHLQKITSDQTWVNEVGRSLGLSEEQIHNHPFRNVLTMAVGARERVEIHSHELALEAGDILLLCSDGLHGPLVDEDVAAALAPARPLPETAADLIARALDNGGPDNVTVVLLQSEE